VLAAGGGSIAGGAVILLAPGAAYGFKKFITSIITN